MSFEKPSKEVMEMYLMFSRLIDKLGEDRLYSIASLVEKNMKNDILFEELRSLRLDNEMKEHELIILCEEEDDDDCCDSKYCCDCGEFSVDCCCHCLNKDDDDCCDDDEDDCTRSYFRNKERFNELLRKSGCHFDEDEEYHCVKCGHKTDRCYCDEDDHCCPGCGYHPSNCHCDVPKSKHPQCNCGGNCK